MILSKARNNPLNMKQTRKLTWKQGTFNQKTMLCMHYKHIKSSKYATSQSLHHSKKKYLKICITQKGIWFTPSKILGHKTKVSTIKESMSGYPKITGMNFRRPGIRSTSIHLLQHPSQVSLPTGVVC
ncbi:hypothetical protein ISCGN_012098 [Ixodes scapularis]